MHNCQESLERDSSMWWIQTIAATSIRENSWRGCSGYTAQPSMRRWNWYLKFMISMEMVSWLKTTSVQWWLPCPWSISKILVRIGRLKASFRRKAEDLIVSTSEWKLLKTWIEFCRFVSRARRRSTRKNLKRWMRRYRVTPSSPF